MPFEVPFIRPVFPEPHFIAKDFANIVESNWYTNFGPREREFATAIAARLADDVTAVTFANATLALMAVLSSVLGRGDGTRTVLIPSFTFAAGAAAIEWAGYKPLLIDIDPDSLQPSLEDARREIAAPERAIAGILLCNTFGIGNTKIDEWSALSQEAGLPLMIDSAAGFGSVYSPGRPVGIAGVTEVFSFHATKPFAIGEGGAAISRDPELTRKLASFQNFGFEDGQGAGGLGLNGKLQEINAAIGLRQLVDFDAAIAARQDVARRYAEVLAPLGVRFPANLEASSVCFASALFADQDSRDAARALLTSRGVEVRTYYSPALHRQRHFSDSHGASGLPITDDVGATILSLPVHTGMTSKTIDMITSTIAEAIA